MQVTATLLPPHVLVRTPQITLHQHFLIRHPPLPPPLTSGCKQGQTCGSVEHMEEEVGAAIVFFRFYWLLSWLTISKSICSLIVPRNVVESGFPNKLRKNKTQNPLVKRALYDCTPPPPSQTWFLYSVFFLCVLFYFSVLLKVIFGGVPGDFELMT